MNADQENHQTETQDIIIHIQWSGPYPFKEDEHLKGSTDYGIYQIYGCHPVYGSGVLLYIGRNEWQTFAERGVKQHGEHLQNQDAGRLELYVGRLIGLKTPDNETWNKHIRFAERLLIHAHRPAWNSQMDLGGMHKELRRVHVVNWCEYRSLMPEVSGARWTDRFDEIKFGQYYNTDHFPQQPEV
jgi:hypothetical protein